MVGGDVGSRARLGQRITLDQANSFFKKGLLLLASARLLSVAFAPAAVWSVLLSLLSVCFILCWVVVHWCLSYLVEAVGVCVRGF